MRTLVFNAGSSSLKFALFEGRDTKELLRGKIEDLETRNAYFTWSAKKKFGRYHVSGSPTHAKAVWVILDFLRQEKYLSETPSRVGHRVVHGGELFYGPTRINERQLKKLRTLSPFAPLHNPPALAVIDAAQRALPKCAHSAVFDTAFTAHVPAESRWYALPLAVQRRYGIRRYGFHGISHAAALAYTAKELGRPTAALNCITIHLGAGCSVTAIRHGRAYETSMGFTPLEGLPMATRSGSIDPEIPLMLEDRGWSRHQVRELLEKQSGWFGLTGKKDFRDVLAGAGWPTPSGWPRPRATAAHRERCQLALAIFVNRITMTVGGYAALLPHVDAIVFTGLVGAGSAALQKAIMRGVVRGGRPRVLVVPPDEERAIARQCL